jgi:non-ribosomal peptide synthetase component E (peptide arylation enzyme)
MNLGGMLPQSARRNPEKAAVICGDRIVSYEALDRSIDALARWRLEELQTGDRVDPLVQFSRSGESLFRLLQGWADRRAGKPQEHRT